MQTSPFNSYCLSRWDSEVKNSVPRADVHCFICDMSSCAVEGTTLEVQEGFRGQSQELTEESASVYTHNANQNDRGGQVELYEEWEIMARAWLCSFPDAIPASMEEVEAWIDSNYSYLPEGIRSMPRSDLCHRLIAIQNCMRLPDQNQEGNQLDLHHARFQRTDQWIPVYAWLESLDKEEVVKSEDITDWLRENPKGIDQPQHDSSFKVHKTVPMKQPVPLVRCSSVTNLPKDSDLYLVKRDEAYRKYKLLLELEKLLSQTSSFSKVNCEEC